MANTEQVAALYRRYADESDASFLTDADVANDLREGYSQFRALVSSVDPWAYATSMDLKLNGGGTFTDYDLTAGGANPAPVNEPALLGATPNANGVPVARMERILALESVDGPQGSPSFRYEPKTSMDGLYATSNGFYFRDQVIRVSGNVSGYVRVTYVPHQGIGIGGAVFDPTWANVIATGTGVYIDDFQSFHDLIALMAYDHYAITDAAQNPVLVARRRGRIEQFVEYLQRRQYAGTHYVTTVSAPGAGGWS